MVVSVLPGEKNGSKEKNDADSLEDCTDKYTDTRTPLERFRPGYLWVSDLTRQHWCEQQLWYSFTVPGIVEENPVMTEGSSLHLARGRFKLTRPYDYCTMAKSKKYVWFSLHPEKN